MKARFKYIFVLLLTTVLFLNFALPCFGAMAKGKITVSLEDKDKNRIDGVNVCLCQIAELNSTGYTPTKDFANSGVSLSGIVNNPDETVAKTIADYVKDRDIVGLSAKSQKGRVSFDGLGLGIWLVYCQTQGDYTFNPFLVFVPYESGGKLIYDVESTPKVEDDKPDEIGIYVIKKWNDKNNAAKKRPDSVFVELLDGENVVSSVELNEGNGWAHTFQNRPSKGEYSVREKSVDGYKVNYSGDVTNGFVITNTYQGEKLPQTGQLWWPIVVMAIAGAGFVLLGIYEIAVKKNEEKK